MRQNKKISNTIYMLIAATLLLSTPLHSQVFHTQEDLNSEVRDQWKDLGLVVPIPVEEEGAEEEDSKYVSVGSGLAMLAALGGAYLMSKKHKKDA